MSLGCAGCKGRCKGKGMAGCAPCGMAGVPEFGSMPRLRGLSDDPLAIAAADILGKDPGDLARRTFVGAATGTSYQWYGCPT